MSEVVQMAGTANMENDVEHPPSVPLIIREENDGEILYIRFLDGLSYKFQHPGVRAYLRWKEDATNFTEGKFSNVYMMDMAFQHCVFPEGHGFKPTLDTIKVQHQGAWQTLLGRFLEGEMES